MQTENKQTATEAAGYTVGISVGFLREMFRGKHISAAIIMAAGAALLLGGSFIPHADTGTFVQVVGVISACAGLAGWIFSSSKR
jgi:hypothetical protein